MNTRSSAKLPTANDIKLINDAHQAVVTSSQSGLEHAIECGEMLRTAKEKVGHGGWENWLADNCPDIAPRTASRYMLLARKGDELEKAAEQNGHALADLSVTAANRLLQKPKTPEQKAAAKAEKEEKQQTAQEQARAKWMKSLGPTGLSELLASLWETSDLRELVEQIKKKLPAPTAPTSSDYRRQPAQPTA
jgi:ribosomal protein L12E/L44/L45/RPP1/RPP2